MASAESVRDILEVFGAIDRAVADAKDPELSAAADKLLPGSADNAGWYAELQQSRFFPSDARTEPNLGEALGRIAAADGKNQRLSAAQKARLLYGISASARIKQLVPKCALPAFDKPDSKLGSALNGSLAAIAPTGTTLKNRRDTAAAVRESFLKHVANNFVGPADFDATVRKPAEQSLRAAKELQAPLCQTAVVFIDNLESVVVDTKFSSDTISLEKLKSIVNPFNWAQDYPELFARMQAQKPELLPGGWRRVLETVSLLGEELTTPLKFYPYQDPARPSEARLDYDLDKSEFGTGDGQVLVDRGFINMKSTVGDPKKPGVRVTTRKVVHIQGISAFAQARLVCIGGYGTSSADFLLGAAAEDRNDREAFDFPTSDKEIDAGKDQQAPLVPPGAAHFVPAAVEAWTESVQDLTNGYFDVAQKWMSGSLTLTDVADYTTRVGGDLASAPWKYLQSMTTPRTPGQPGSAK
jgi:hypothetical protein